MNDPDDDPSNVKPIQQKVLVPKHVPKEMRKETPVETSPVKVGKENTSLNQEQLNKIMKAVGQVPNNFKAQSLLKLNHYSKNCSQADSADDNCDFVHKNWDYTSATASSSSSSMCDEHAASPKVSPVMVTHINRPEPVKASGSKDSLAIGQSKPKDKEKKHDEEKPKDHKEHHETGATDEGKKEINDSKEKNVGGKSKTKLEKASKENNNKDKADNHKPHSKDQSKDAKEKEKDVSKDKDGGNKKKKK